MAGHSKWANIKHRKSEQNAKRGKIFTKIIRELVTATRTGGCDPSSNSRLRTVIDKALFNNMTRNTMNRAIARGVKNDHSNMTATVLYEGYGPGGVAIMLECISNNRNRTVSTLRHILNKCGGNLGTDGSVSYLFNKIGIISFNNINKPDYILEEALKLGAKDVIIHNSGNMDVHTGWEELYSIMQSLELNGIKAHNATITMIPSTKIKIDNDITQKLLKLINMLEACDDVEKIFHNANLANINNVHQNN